MPRHEPTLFCISLMSTARARRLRLSLYTAGNGVLLSSLSRLSCVNLVQTTIIKLLGKVVDGENGLWYKAGSSLHAGEDSHSLSYGLHFILYYVVSTAPVVSLCHKPLVTV